MCGILYYYDAASADQIETENLDETFCRALATMQHRGPDGSGVYRVGRSHFGHNRLSILDLSDAAAQPMQNEETGNTIVFNGEIYNYRELFRRYFPGDPVPKSDTIVLFRLLNEHGSSIVGELNGMFSFVYFIKKENKIIYCRDRLGIKPLYIAESASAVVISSEMKGIFPFMESGIDFNIEKCGEWALFGNVLGEDTVYERIKKAEPGVIYERWLDTSVTQESKYWCPARYSVRSTKGKKKESSKLLQAIRNSVSRQLVSDVPVGVFLSGGVDSSAIAKIASEESEVQLHTYTATFDYSKTNEEAETARRLADEIGTIHHEVHIGTENLEKHVKQLVQNHDGPFSDAASIPLTLLCGAVDDEVKVILQGDGGDELFGGYNRYSLMTYYQLLNSLCKIPLLRLLCSYSEPLDRFVHAFSQADYLGTVGWLLTEDTVKRATWNHFPGLDTKDAFSSYYKSRINDMQDAGGNLSIVDIQNILPDIFLEKVDRSTMSKSKEIRVPLLDNEVVDYIIPLRASGKWPFGQKKFLLRSALEQTLPNYVLSRKKHGFGVPYGMWLRHDLKVMFLDNVSDFCRNNRGFLDQKSVESRFTEFCDATSGSGFDMWKIFMFVLWRNTLSEKVSIS